MAKNNNNDTALAALIASEETYAKEVETKRAMRKSSGTKRPRQHYDLVIDIYRGKSGKTTGGCHITKIKPCAETALGGDVIAFLNEHRTLRTENLFKFLKACGKTCTIEFYPKYSKLFKGERKARYYQTFNA